MNRKEEIHKRREITIPDEVLHWRVPLDGTGLSGGPSLQKFRDGHGPIQNLSRRKTMNHREIRLDVDSKHEAESKSLNLLEDRHLTDWICFCKNGHHHLGKEEQHKQNYRSIKLS